MILLINVSTVYYYYNHAINDTYNRVGCPETTGVRKQREKIKHAGRGPCSKLLKAHENT